MEKVYEFLYNSDCCELNATTISIHKTLKGAEMAMEFHKNKVKKEWEGDKIEFSRLLDYPWDFDQWLGIKETNLEE